MGSVLTVNVGEVRVHGERIGRTGIDKRPMAGAIEVRAPERKGVSGLVTDQIDSAAHHGGADQAVYAYAREDLDAWQDELNRTLANGRFGENLTTIGIDVTGAVIGERWRIGDELELQVSVPRIPCSTFAGWMAEPGWVKTFTRRARPGAYLRVLRSGTVRAGDPITVIDRPAHGVTIGVTFRAVTLEPELLPLLLDAPELPEEVHDLARRRNTHTAG